MALRPDEKLASEIEDTEQDDAQPLYDTRAFLEPAQFQEQAVLLQSITDSSHRSTTPFGNLAFSPARVLRPDARQEEKDEKDRKESEGDESEQSDGSDIEDILDQLAQNSSFADEMAERARLLLEQEVERERGIPLPRIDRERARELVADEYRTRRQQAALTPIAERALARSAIRRKIRRSRREGDAISRIAGSNVSYARRQSRSRRRRSRNRLEPFQPGHPMYPELLMRGRNEYNHDKAKFEAQVRQRNIQSEERFRREWRALTGIEPPVLVPGIPDPGPRPSDEDLARRAYMTLRAERVAARYARQVRRLRRAREETAEFRARWRARYEQELEERLGMLPAELRSLNMDDDRPVPKFLFHDPLHGGEAVFTTDPYLERVQNWRHMQCVADSRKE